MGSEMCIRDSNSTQPAGIPVSLLQGEGVSLIRSDRKLVTHVSLDLAAGELVGLIGPNGAGKSSLLNLLAGLVACDEGSVQLNNKNIAQIPLQQKSRLLAWVAQSGPVNWPLSVERLVALGRRPHLSAWQRLSVADKTAIDNAITATDCDAIRTQDATTLSGGERTRMLLARAMAAEPRVLLADEPIAALDLKHQLQTMQLLRKFSTGDNACLVVLHDLSMASRFCDRLYLMHEGVIVADGIPADVLSHENVRTVYGVEVVSGGGDIPYIVPVREL